MNTTILEQPETDTSAADSSDTPIEVLQIRLEKGDYLQDMFVNVAGVLFCIFIAGVGIYFLIDEGPRPINWIVAFMGLIGTKAQLSSVMNIHDRYQDDEPKLTLSHDAICDHRTDMNVEFIDARSIFFDQQTYRGNDIRANLQLTMKDGTEHIFDLRGLEAPSEKIAQRVKAVAGLKDGTAPGKTTDSRQDLLLKIMAGTMVGLLIVRVIAFLCGF